MNELFNDLKNLGNLIYIVSYGKESILSIKSYNKIAGQGIKTKKYRKKKTFNNLMFRRILLKKRFKKPLFLSLK
jgi:hypothetical protein